MPQITAEKKFFLLRIDKNTQYFASVTTQVIAVTGFQELQKNITGGAE